MKNYGVEFYSQSEEYRQKYISTMMRKFGVVHYSQTDEFKEKYRNTVMKKFGEYPMFRHMNRSKGELQVFEFVKTIIGESIEVMTNDRTQMVPNERNQWKCNHELDIWIPELNFAIEFNGTHWHDPLLFPEKWYND